MTTLQTLSSAVKVATDAATQATGQANIATLASKATQKAATEVAANAGAVAAAAAVAIAINNRLYPGLYAADPVTRPDGSAVVDGDVCSLVSGVMRVHIAGAWQDWTTASGAAAAASADAAALSEAFAEEWASETASDVDGAGNYSAKEYAQGTQPATGGSSKNWAQQTGAGVTGAAAGSRSAKSWSQDNLTPTGANLGGSSKDWAQGAGLPDGVNKSAKGYALDSVANAATATAAAASAQTYNASAQTAKAASEAAAESSGPVNFYDTYALANAAVGGLANLAVAEVFVDETRNGQRTRYRKEGGVLVFKVAMPAYRTWYVDSVAGLDANAGSAPSAPFQTLAKVLTVLQGGDTLYLARGGEWRESFDLGTRQLCTIDAYGSGALPIINGADLIPGGTWVLESGNVYRVDVVMPELGTGSRCYPGVFEDGEGLYEFDITMDAIGSLAAAVAAVQGRPGSFILWSGGSYTAGWAAGATLRYYVQASDGGNPAANGKTYEARKRLYTLQVNRTRVRNLVCRRQVHHDGVSLSLSAAADGAGGSYYRVCFDQMPRHSVIDPVAAFDSCVAMRRNVRYEGYGFHAYKSVLGNFSPRYKNCVAINVGTGWGTHSANLGVSSHKRLSYDNCIAIGCTTGFGGYDFDNGEYFQCKTVDCATDVSASAGANVATTFTECEFQGATFRPFAAPTTGRKCTIRRSKMACQTPDGYFLNVNDTDAGTLEVLDGSEVVWHRSYQNVSTPAFINAVFANRSWQKITLKDSIFTAYASAGWFVRTLGTGVVTAWDVSNCIFGGFLDSQATNVYRQRVRGSIAGANVADMFTQAGWSDNQLLDPRKVYRGLPVRDGFDKRQFAPVPRGGQFNAITYSGTGNVQPRGVVAVGKTIAFMQYGPDAFTRTIDTPASEMFGIGFDQTSVTYTAVGANGLMRRSTAGSFGTVWATVGAALTAQTLRGCSGKAATSIMVAVGDNNTVLRSADGGATWAAATTPPATAGTNWRDVACDGTTFVAVGAGGKTAWSTDGNVWTEVTTGTTSFRAITPTGTVGTFVAVGDTQGSGTDAEIKSTANSGAAWTARTSNCQSDLLDVAYGAGRYVAVADSNSALQGPEVITSTDFITWTPLGVDAPFAIRSVCYAGYLQIRWTMAGQSNVFGQSSDGQMWSYVQALEMSMAAVAKARSGIEGYVRALL